jgi:hypothetical protein
VADGALRPHAQRRRRPRRRRGDGAAVAQLPILPQLLHIILVQVKEPGHLAAVRCSLELKPRPLLRRHGRIPSHLSIAARLRRWRRRGPRLAVSGALRRGGAPLTTGRHDLLVTQIAVVKIVERTRGARGPTAAALWKFARRTCARIHGRRRARRARRARTSGFWSSSRSRSARPSQPAARGRRPEVAARRYDEEGEGRAHRTALLPPAEAAHHDEGRHDNAAGRDELRDARR